MEPITLAATAGKHRDKTRQQQAPGTATITGIEDGRVVCQGVLYARRRQARRVLGRRPERLCSGSGVSDRDEGGGSARSSASKHSQSTSSRVGNQEAFKLSEIYGNRRMESEADIVAYQ